MPLKNCKVNPILTWPKECVISSNALAAQATAFTITDTFYLTWTNCVCNAN